MPVSRERPEATRPTEGDRALALRLLALETRGATCAAERADAGARVFERTFAALSPVVGRLGVAAIFTRSVRLTQREFPCLQATGLDEDSGGVDPRLCHRGCLAGGDAAHRSEVAAALCTRFFALIAALIGEPLASRIILTAWPDTAAPSTAKEGIEG